MTAGGDRGGGALCRGLQLLVLGKKNWAVDSPWGIICSNVERNNKFKRFEGAVSKTFIVASHQMAIKHLQEVSSFVDCPGAEVFGFLACGLFWSKISTPSEVIVMLLKSWLVVNTASNTQVKDYLISLLIHSEI